MNRSQHRVARRECPRCHLTKEFPIRNEFCGPQCAQVAHQKPLDSDGETHTITGNTWEISIPRTRLYTLDELLGYCQVDLSQWAVDRFVVNQYEARAGGRQADTGCLAVSG